MSTSSWATCAALLFSLIQAAAHAQEHQHGSSGQASEETSQGRPVTLEGTLVDAAWFAHADRTANDDQVAKAAKRLADGGPAALLPGGSRRPQDMLYLLTNSAVLAPYAGATVKVEGLAFDDVRAIRPKAVYLKDGEEWRQVQLREEAQKGVPPQGAAMEHGGPGEVQSGQKPAAHDKAKHGEPAGAQHGEAASSKPAEGAGAKRGESAGAQHGAAASTKSAKGGSIQHSETKPGEATGAHGGMADKKEQAGGMMSMMDNMETMGNDAMNVMGAMPGEAMAQSSLPGVPGASHLHHIGAAGFFLDHQEHIQLSTEQRKKLSQMRENALLEKATADRNVEEAEQQLWKLTAADQPDLAQIEAKVREIEKLRGDQRLTLIRPVIEAAKVLTEEQTRILLGTAAPDMPAAKPATPGDKPAAKPEHKH